MVCDGQIQENVFGPRWRSASPGAGNGPEQSTGGEGTGVSTTEAQSTPIDFRGRSILDKSPAGLWFSIDATTAAVSAPNIYGLARLPIIAMTWPGKIDTQAQVYAARHTENTNSLMPPCERFVRPLIRGERLRPNLGLANLWFQRSASGRAGNTFVRAAAL